jgi:hypothetical protein
MPCDDCSRTESCPPCPDEDEEPPMTPEEEEQAPEYRCTCGETACESELCDCDYAPCPVDHAREASEDKGVCPRCKGSAIDPEHSEGGGPYEEPYLEPCAACQLPPPEGPEYTPCVCGHIEPDHAPAPNDDCAVCACSAYRTKPDFELPPQPERRPPYAVVYSVGGHLYEVAVSGDAAVRAVDGALVITHDLGPIAGIVQTAPLINEESA